MPKGYRGRPRSACGLATDGRRELLRRTDDASAATARAENAVWRQARCQTIAEAVAHAIRLLRALAEADAAAGLMEASSELREEIGVFESALGPTPGVAELPSARGDIERLRAAKGAARVTEHDRRFWRQNLPAPDRRRDLRRQEDTGRAEDLALASVLRRAELTLICAGGAVGRQARAFGDAGYREMRDFLRGEGFVLTEVFAGRSPPTTLEERLHALRVADARAEEKGYKD